MTLTLANRNGGAVHGSRGGFGINRRTWQTGQALGRTISKMWKASGQKRAAAKKTRRIERYSTNVEPMGISGPGSQHNFVFRGNGRKPRAGKDVAPPIMYVTNAGTSQSCSESFQDFCCPVSLYSKTDLTTMSQFAGAGTVTTERLIHHHYVKGELQIANSVNSTLRVTVYYVEPKMDLSTVTDPAYAVKNFLADSNTDGVLGTSTFYRRIGVTPTSIAGFKELFKIVNQVDLLLEQGQVHLERYRFDLNKSIDSDKFKYSSSGIKDATRFIMVQVHGTPEWATATPTSVSTCAGRISMVNKLEYHYSVVEQSVVQVQFANTIAALTNPLIEERYKDDFLAPAT